MTLEPKWLDCPRKTGKNQLDQKIFCHGCRKLVFDSGQDRETWYHRSRWFGLFSVPAPPFRFTASGGVFIFLPDFCYNHAFQKNSFRGPWLNSVLRVP